MEDLKWLWYENRIYILGYILIVGCLSFTVCYKHGPLVEKRSRNLLMWTLRLLALLLVYAGVTAPRFACMVMVLLSSGNLRYPLKAFGYMSHGVSAPAFVSSAQMAEVVSTREGSLLGVGVHFHGVEVFSRPTQELGRRPGRGGIAGCAEESDLILGTVEAADTEVRWWGEREDVGSCTIGMGPICLLAQREDVSGGSGAGGQASDITVVQAGGDGGLEELVARLKGSRVRGTDAGCFSLPCVKRSLCQEEAGHSTSSRPLVLCRVCALRNPRENAFHFPFKHHCPARSRVCSAQNCEGIAPAHTVGKPQSRDCVPVFCSEPRADAATTRALEELRQACRSPGFPSWLAVSRLQAPKNCRTFFSLRAPTCTVQPTSVRIGVDPMCFIGQAIQTAHRRREEVEWDVSLASHSVVCLSLSISRRIHKPFLFSRPLCKCHPPLMQTCLHTDFILDKEVGKRPY
ncbi:Nuclear envelope integral membrane protein 2 [Camelus dromedarius]|uniref:Nuclear envelope integral membrane protein 2 n=1 Tax=Camelus dromedarius TaxID=9838 RepID=A0A5N4E566_CAMDR|nr:Nuclear envelope integral membrane protein 2 [Camelus dromedarius]